MKRIMLTALLAFAFGLGLTLMASTESMAVHKGAGGLACGGCHTMHNSQGNLDMGGAVGGTLKLLRTTSTTVSGFCYLCHQNGGALDASYDAPHVKNKAGSAALWTNALGFDKIGAGGDFYYLDATVDGNLSNALGYGHSLEATGSIPPGTGGLATAGTITCTNCHDPHGADNTGSATVHGYRNLRKTPGEPAAGAWVNMTSINANLLASTGYTPIRQGGGTVATVAVAADTTYTIWPVVESAASANRYGLAGGNQDTGMSSWCATCHRNWHVGNTEDISNDWKRHPTDTALNDITLSSGSGVKITSTTQYTDTTIITWDKRLPLANVTAAQTYANVTNANLTANTTDNRVFCLSCHFAHAGPNPDGLRWSHAAQGNSTAAANAIASNVGCQQCHNR